MQPGDHVTDQGSVGDPLQVRDTAGPAGLRASYNDALEAHRGTPAPALGSGALRPNILRRSSSRANLR